jgi:hypothetical protein
LKQKLAKGNLINPRIKQTGRLAGENKIGGKRA